MERHLTRFAHAKPITEGTRPLQRFDLALDVAEALRLYLGDRVGEQPVQECIDPEWFARLENGSGVIGRLRVSEICPNGVVGQNGNGSSKWSALSHRAERINHRLAALAAEYRVVQAALYSLSQAVSAEDTPMHRTMLMELHTALDYFTQDESVFLTDCERSGLCNTVESRCECTAESGCLAAFWLKHDQGLKGAQAVLNFNRRGIFTNNVLQTLLDRVESIRQHAKSATLVNRSVRLVYDFEASLDKIEAIAHMPAHIVSVVEIVEREFRRLQGGECLMVKALDCWLQDKVAGLFLIWTLLDGQPESFETFE
jgi:hypothetical protein